MATDDETVDSGTPAAPGDGGSGASTERHDGDGEGSGGARTPEPPSPPHKGDDNGELAKAIREQNEYLRKLAENSEHTRKLTEETHKAIFSGDEDPESDEGREGPLEDGEREVSIVEPAPPPQPHAPTGEEQPQQHQKTGWRKWY